MFLRCGGRFVAGVVIAAVVFAGCRESAEDRRATIYELKRNPDPDNIELIRGFLDDDDRDIRAMALFALFDLGTDDALEVARAGVDDPDGYVRSVAATVLGEIEDPSMVPVLTTLLLEDEDPKVRRAAALSLGAIGGPDAVVALSQALVDPMKEVRFPAAKGVADLDPLSSVETLSVMVIDDPDWEIRAQAARALGRTGLPELIPVLERAENDPNEFVR
ncbi:MAG: HEAT repeat domain-containing protein, partial [Acidobacteriota bacterium]|nr:HEAT repeat domain-containing protein [Acidobacteriota bacterium]